MKSAWYDKSRLPKEMAYSAKYRWKLEDAKHLKYLVAAIDACHGKTMVDLGCGPAEVGRVFPDLDYTGYDLPHIIDEVAKKVNPSFKYESFDAYEDSLEFCANYDIILSNSFLTELNPCGPVLYKILDHAKKYVILHRQGFAKEERVNKYKTYAGLTTTNCVICATEFNARIADNFEVIYDEIYGALKTVALKRINV